MNQIQTQKYKSDPPRFNMVGQRLTPTIQESEGSISAGLVKRLLSYATKAIEEAGFEKLTKEASITVYQIDDNKQYNVRWKNEKGGYIELCAIHTNNGWPHLDYGFSIGVELS